MTGSMIPPGYQLPQNVMTVMTPSQLHFQQQQAFSNTMSSTRSAVPPARPPPPMIMPFQQQPHFNTMPYRASSVDPYHREQSSQQQLLLQYQLQQSHPYYQPRKKTMSEVKLSEVTTVIKGSGSNLNAKVFKTDDQGNFVKHYLHHHRQRSLTSCTNLNQEERMQLYQEIQKDVQEKYFGRRSASVDDFDNRKSPRTTGKPPIFSASQTTASVTSRILSKYDDHRLRNRVNSKEELMQQITVQQQQLQHLNQQQQYLQAQVLWQQKQMRESQEHDTLERLRTQSSSPRSSNKSTKDDDKQERARNRLQIHEQMQKQQKQVAQHILHLQTQLNLLIQRKNLIEDEKNANQEVKRIEQRASSPMITFQRSSTEEKIGRSVTENVHQREEDNEEIESEDDEIDIFDESEEYEPYSVSKAENNNRPKSPNPDFMSPHNLYLMRSTPPEPDTEDPDEIWLKEEPEGELELERRKIMSEVNSRRGVFRRIQSQASKELDHYLEDTTVDDMELPSFEDEDKPTSKSPNPEVSSKVEKRVHMKEEEEEEIADHLFDYNKKLRRSHEEENLRAALERELRNQEVLNDQLNQENNLQILQKQDHELMEMRLQKERDLEKEIQEKKRLLEEELNIQQKDLMKRAEEEMLRQQQEFLVQQQILFDQQQLMEKQRQQLEEQQRSLQRLQSNSTAALPSNGQLQPPSKPRKRSSTENVLTAVQQPACLTASMVSRAVQEPPRPKSPLPSVLSQDNQENTSPISSDSPKVDRFMARPDSSRPLQLSKNMMAQQNHQQNQSNLQPTVSINRRSPSPMPCDNLMIPGQEQQQPQTLQGNRSREASPSRHSPRSLSPIPVSRKRDVSPVKGSEKIESFMDHFDHYGTRPPSNNAVPITKRVTRSMSKENMNRTPTQARFGSPFGVNSAVNGLRGGLDDDPEASVCDIQDTVGVKSPPSPSSPAYFTPPVDVKTYLSSQAQGLIDGQLHHPLSSTGG